MHQHILYAAVAPNTPGNTNSYSPENPTRDNAGSCVAEYVQCTWERTLGGPLNDKAYAATAMPDGGYAIAGQIVKSFLRGKDAGIISLNSEGQVLWELVLGEHATDQVFDIVSTADGDLFVVGHTRSKGMGASDVWVVHLSSSGRVLWERTFGGEKNDRAYGAAPGPKEGVVIAGIHTLERRRRWRFLDHCT